MKFGGSSLADAEKITAAAKRALRQRKAGNRVVMVVSAMGKTTDKLVALARDVTPNPPKREMDQLLATGEQVNRHDHRQRPHESQDQEDRYRPYRSPA